MVSPSQFKDLCNLVQDLVQITSDKEKSMELELASARRENEGLKQQLQKAYTSRSDEHIGDKPRKIIPNDDGHPLSSSSQRFSPKTKRSPENLSHEPKFRENFHSQQTERSSHTISLRSNPPKDLSANGRTRIDIRQIMQPTAVDDDSDESINAFFANITTDDVRREYVERGLSTSGNHQTRVSPTPKAQTVDDIRRQYAVLGMGKSLANVNQLDASGSESDDSQPKVLRAKVWPSANPNRNNLDGYMRKNLEGLRMMKRPSEPILTTKPAEVHQEELPTIAMEYENEPRSYMDTKDLSPRKEPADLYQPPPVSRGLFTELPSPAIPLEIPSPVVDRPPSRLLFKHNEPTGFNSKPIPPPISNSRIGPVRAVHLSELPNDITYKELLAPVNGGLIDKAIINFKRLDAAIIFFEHSACVKYHSKVSKQGFHVKTHSGVHTCTIETLVVNDDSRKLKESLMQSVYHEGVTRVLKLRHVHPRISLGKLKQDMMGDIERTMDEVLEDAVQIGIGEYVLRFTAISYATWARKALRARVEYTVATIEYGPDPCGSLKEKPDVPPKQYVNKFKEEMLAPKTLEVCSHFNEPDLPPKPKPLPGLWNLRAPSPARRPEDHWAKGLPAASLYEESTMNSFDTEYADHILRRRLLELDEWKHRAVCLLGLPPPIEHSELMQYIKGGTIDACYIFNGKHDYEFATAVIIFVHQSSAEEYAAHVRSKRLTIRSRRQDWRITVSDTIPQLGLNREMYNTVHVAKSGVNRCLYFEGIPHGSTVQSIIDDINHSVHSVRKENIFYEAVHIRGACAKVWLDSIANAAFVLSDLRRHCRKYLGCRIRFDVDHCSGEFSQIGKEIAEKDDWSAA